MLDRCRVVKTNFHTHTSFADGKNTAEEMLLSAIERSGEAIGFSEHGYTPMDTSWCMSIDGTEDYISEIKRLKEKYASQIKVYCGIEADFFTEYDRSRFDYAIGSVHYVLKDGVYIPVDKSADDTDRYVSELYGGDYLAYARDYFALAGKVIEKTGADIIGHLDVLYKFNERRPRFDEEGDEFLKVASDAIDELLPYNKPFEVNTGAISRGYKKMPYPSAKLIDYIASKGGRFIMSSDSHSVSSVYFGLDDAYELLISRGVPRERILFYPF